MPPLISPFFSPTFDGSRTVPSKEVTDLMLELLQLTPEDKLLEIGTGSGYQTQRFANTGAEVHSIELEPWIDPTVVIGECVFLHHRNGVHGLPEVAPFTAIVATCGVEQIPDEWTKQLAEDGRLVVPIGNSQAQRLARFRKRNDTLIPERIAAYVRFQMLREKPVPKPVKPVYKDKVYGNV